MEAVLQKTSAAGPRISDTTYTNDSKHLQSPTTTALYERSDARSSDIPALRHKVDRHIVPIMFLCYLMNFIDKVALNVCTGEIDLQHSTILTLRTVCSGHGPQQGSQSPGQRVLKRSDCVLRCILDCRDTDW